MADIVKKKWIHDIEEVKEDGTVVLGDQVAPMTFMECVIDANGNTFENKLANVEANVATRLATKVSEAPYDDQYYARFNGEWKVVPGTGGAIAAEDVTFDVTGTAIPAANDTVQKAIAYVAENAGGNVEVDGTTISKTADDKLQIKDGGVSADKLDAALTAEIAGKVDAETGKGLSSNDYTDAEKAKVATVPTTLTTDLAKLTALPDASALEADLDSKADKESPALTGTPTAPTAAAGTNTQQIATTAFVTSAVEAETTARTSAIATETSARTAADTLLTTNLETLATKEANDVNGLQAQITAGVATSGTITMAAVMDGTTDYSAETDVAPSRHAVQSFVNAQDAQLETEIEDLAQELNTIEARNSSVFGEEKAITFGEEVSELKIAQSSSDVTKGVIVTQTTGATTSYKVSYITQILKKGTTVKFSAKTSSNARTQNVGWTKTDPSTLGTLLGLELDKYQHKSALGEFVDEYVAPYDGYLVFYYYAANWSNRTWTVIEPNEEYIKTIKEKIEEVSTNVEPAIELTDYIEKFGWSYTEFDFDDKIVKAIFYEESPVITTGDNNNYIVYYKYFEKGTRIRFVGNTDGTAKKMYFGMCSELPSIGSAVTDFYGFICYSTEITIDYVVPYSGYLVAYRHNSNWVNIKYKSAKLFNNEDKKNLDKYEELIVQAKYVASAPTTKSLGLLHFTDIHGDDVAVETIKAVADKYTSYIDEILCTGDSIQYYADGTTAYPHGASWWTSCVLAEKSLFIVGNHDAATPSATSFDQQENSAAWDGKGKAWCSTTYFEPYESALGITRPSGECYWHKDYADQKIRVIGLDCLHRFDGVLNPETGAIEVAGLKHTTTEQEVWLIAKLNETLDSSNTTYGYSVVFACHYPLDNFTETPNETWNDATHKFVYNQGSGAVIDYKTGEITNFNAGTSFSAELKFNMRNRVDNGYSTGSAYPNYTQGATNNIANIIGKWIDNGGKYVIWLCGHTHYDMMYYPTNYPNMLVLANDQAGCLRGSNCADRSENLASRTAANFVSIDTENGWISMVRIGLNYNKKLISKRFICYDYKNRKVINEG